MLINLELFAYRLSHGWTARGYCLVVSSNCPLDDFNLGFRIEGGLQLADVDHFCIDGFGGWWWFVESVRQEGFVQALEDLLECFDVLGSVLVDSDLVCRLIRE